MQAAWGEGMCRHEIPAAHLEESAKQSVVGVAGLALQAAAALFRQRRWQRADVRHLPHAHHASGTLPWCRSQDMEDFEGIGCDMGTCPVHVQQQLCCLCCQARKILREFQAPVQAAARRQW